MSHSTTITFSHADARHPEEEADLCRDEIEVELEREPDDHNYGADADGNRGMFVSGYWFPETNPPDKCETCGRVYTAEDKEEIENLMNKAAETYDWEPDYD